MAENYGYAIDAGFQGLLAALGVRAEDVLRRCGLPVDLFEQSTPRVDTEQFFAFAQAIQDSVDDPLLPIRFVDAASPEWLSPAVFAALRSPNLVTAALRLARYKPLIAPVRLRTDNGPKGLTISYQWLEGKIRAPPLLSGSEALFLVKLARMGTRHEVEATAVTMRELPVERQAHEAYLGCRIETGECLSVTFSPEDATRPFLTHNPAMWASLEPQLEQQLAALDRDASLEAQARALVMEPARWTAVHRRCGATARPQLAQLAAEIAGRGNDLPGRGSAHARAARAALRRRHAAQLWRDRVPTGL